MLGFPLVYFKGMRLMMFQLSGFYYRSGVCGFNETPDPLKVDGFLDAKLHIEAIWGFRKLGIPCLGVLIIRILLFRVLY